MPPRPLGRSEDVRRSADRMHMRSPSRTVVLVLAILTARTAAAQERRSSSPPVDIDAAQWEPLGQIAVARAGAGGRGYVLAPEGADVTAPGTDQFSFHVVAANNFSREQTWKEN